MTLARWAGLLCLRVSQVAQAQSKEVQQKARAHFQQGKSYQDNGAYDDAVREYQEAYKLVPLPDLLFNIGQAYRLKGDRKHAIEAYEKYLAAAPEGGASDEARDHIRTLKLELQVEEAQAASKRALEAADAARKRADAEATVRRRGEEEIRTRQIEAEARRRMEADEAARKQRDDERARAGHGWRVWGWTCGIVGGVALAGSIAMGVSAHSKSDQVSQASSWSVDLSSSADTGQTRGTVSTVLFVSGVGLVATGGLFYWLGVREHNLTVTPAMGSSFAGMIIGGRF